MFRGVVLLMVYADANRDVFALRRSRNQHPFGARFEVTFRFVSRRKQSSRLDYDFATELRPRQLRRPFSHRQTPDALSVYDQCIVALKLRTRFFARHLTAETAL